MARRRVENPEAIAWAKIKSTYGLEKSQYERLLQEAGGRCLVCEIPFGKSGTSRMVIDHNHETGKVRGLICSGCNTAIGYVREDLERLARLAEYLRGHGAQ